MLAKLPRARSASIYDGCNGAEVVAPAPPQAAQATRIVSSRMSAKKPSSEAISGTHRRALAPACVGVEASDAEKDRSREPGPHKRVATAKRCALRAHRPAAFL